MEFCALNSEDLISIARENVIQTYVGLADSVEGTQRIASPLFQGVLSLNPFAFCNFVIGLQGDEHGRVDGVRELVQLAYRQSALRVFGMTGDSPSSWTPALEAAGFRSLHHLVQMVWYPVQLSDSGIALTECEDLTDRTNVSRFMVDQFFAVNEPRFRATVLQATLKSGNRLLCYQDSGLIVGAVMISQDKNCVGLYNLCVHSRARRRGIGEGMLRSIQAIAAGSTQPVVLQCDRKLVGWYAKAGFVEFGEIQSFHHRF